MGKDEEEEEESVACATYYMKLVHVEFFFFSFDKRSTFTR